MSFYFSFKKVIFCKKSLTILKFVKFSTFWIEFQKGSLRSEIFHRLMGRVLTLQISTIRETPIFRLRLIDYKIHALYYWVFFLLWQYVVPILGVKNHYFHAVFFNESSFLKYMQWQSRTKINIQHESCDLPNNKK